MGQEASLPVDGGDGSGGGGGSSSLEFDTAAAQAAAVAGTNNTATTTMNPQSGVNAMYHQNHHILQHNSSGVGGGGSGKDGAPRSSRKIMAAILRGGGGGQQQQQQNHQYGGSNHGSGYDQPRGNNYNNSTPNSYNHNGGHIPPPGGHPQQYPQQQQQQQQQQSRGMMSNSSTAAIPRDQMFVQNMVQQNSNHHQQQQQQPSMGNGVTQQQQIQQQMQQVNHVGGNSHASVYQQQQETTDRTAAAVGGGGSSIGYDRQNSKTKITFPGSRAASARGAAIISSMRNLSLGGALRKQNSNLNKQQQQQLQQQHHHHQHQPQGVQDWEKQWDEDEDDSEEGDDSEDLRHPMMQQQQQHAALMPQQQSHPLHQQMRPGMDVGHSSIVGGMATPQPSVDLLAMSALEAQQLASPSAIIPTNIANNNSNTVMNSHTSQPPTTTMMTTNMIKSEPPNFVSPEISVPQQKQQQLQQQQYLLQQQQQQVLHHQQQTMQAGSVSAVSSTSTDEDDGVEWDTNAAVAASLLSDEEVERKPSVQMFMPMLRVLGKGSFGKVVLVQKNAGKERGGLFAMKILRKTHLVKKRQIERTRTERKVLSVVNHPFIMKLHYAFQTDEKLYLVLDYCPGGELFFHLSRFRRFPERVARFYSAELLLAIGHLHKRGIIYRDLKPENVLLDADGHVKLGDFGLAKAGIQHPCEGATSMCGTPEYMAPEVLAQQGHGFCVDYWGLGMIVYEMMTGLPPWYTTDRAKLFRRLKSAPLDVPSYFSVGSANCVSALLERNPRRRLGVAGIRTAMEHEFFKNISWRSLYARRVEAPIRPCEGWKPPEAMSGESNHGGAGAGFVGQQHQQHSMNLNHVDALDARDLEAATANFDNTFTRMPVESEDTGQDGNSDGDDGAGTGYDGEQLDENTFRGFSFDIRERDDIAAATTTVATTTSAGATRSQPQSPQRYSTPQHTLD